MRFNADYAEVNVAPFGKSRPIRLRKVERAALYDAAVNMASNGVAVTDDDDEIIFHGTGGNGTGYRFHGDFEQRIEGKVSQIILGHADALKSIPVNSATTARNRPHSRHSRTSSHAMETVSRAIVNGVLFERLRSMGFNIAPGSTAIMLNDNEENENATNMADLGVKMKSAGIQMDPAYFTEKNGHTDNRRGRTTAHGQDRPVVANR